MQTFKEFLLGKRLVSEKRLPYYINWVSRFQNFCGIKAGQSFTKEQVEYFLKEMDKSHEDWRNKQVKAVVHDISFLWIVKRRPSVAWPHSTRLNFRLSS